MIQNIKKIQENSQATDTGTVREAVTIQKTGIIRDTGAAQNQNMDIMKAKRLVIEAGKRLVSSGLIRRTWGNVSCRVSPSQFVITPSGRNYLDLTPDEIVLIQLPDLSYEGNVLPSSEMQVHGAAYQMRPDANFIIHTHQEQASVVSALGIASIPVPKHLTRPQASVAAQTDPVSVLGTCVPCAAYALPGTKELCRNTMEALSSTQGRAVMMRCHGALCLGSSCEEAFDAAMLLEQVCAQWLSALSESAPQHSTAATGSDHKIDRKINFKTDRSCDRKIESALRGLIAAQHPEARFVCRTADPAVLAAARAGGVEAWLDDFAQMIGPCLSAIDPSALLSEHLSAHLSAQQITQQTAQQKTAPSAPAAGAPAAQSLPIQEALLHRSAALIAGFGGLCWAAEEADADAAGQLLEKNCRAFYFASLLRAQLAARRPASAAAAQIDAVKPIPVDEAVFMRQNYLDNYSKRIKK